MMHHHHHHSNAVINCHCAGLRQSLVAAEHQVSTVTQAVMTVGVAKPPAATCYAAEPPNVHVCYAVRYTTVYLLSMVLQISTSRCQAWSSYVKSGCSGCCSDLPTSLQEGLAALVAVGALHQGPAESAVVRSWRICVWRLACALLCIATPS